MIPINRALKGCREKFKVLAKLVPNLQHGENYRITSKARGACLKRWTDKSREQSQGEGVSIKSEYKKLGSARPPLNLHFWRRNLLTLGTFLAQINVVTAWLIDVKGIWVNIMGWIEIGTQYLVSYSFWQRLSCLKAIVVGYPTSGSQTLFEFEGSKVCRK